MVKAGWFNDEAEAMRSALREFVRRNRLELLERFQREDITRALKQGERRREECLCDTSVVLHFNRCEADLETTLSLNPVDPKSLTGTVPRSGNCSLPPINIPSSQS